MNRRNSTIAFFAAAGMVMLILDGKTALSGALEGIKLCMSTLIPSLFPFFLLSVLLTTSLSGQAVPLLRPITRLCKIPDGTESIVAAGFLGGYPVGAQNVKLLYQSGQISSHQAARMITFCNNAGPAFIFGVVGFSFSSKIAPWLIWSIHILSSVAVGTLLPCSCAGSAIRVPEQKISLPKALEQSVRVMALVCGWVVIMRLVIAFLTRWFLWLLPGPMQILICGFLELSNGCVSLHLIEDEGLRFVIASALLSLGGLCVTLQTASVADHISLRFYYPGKLLQSCISIILGCLILPVIFHVSIFQILLPVFVFSSIGAACILSFRLFEKNSGISVAVGV